MDGSNQWHGQDSIVGKGQHGERGSASINGLDAIFGDFDSNSKA